MKRATEIDRLEGLARLVLDLRLADLSRVARQRQECLDRLAALEPAAAEDLDPVSAARALLLYQAWADGRRAEINGTLARLTADWAQKSAAARTAFARTEALRLVKARIG